MDEVTFWEWSKGFPMGLCYGPLPSSRGSEVVCMGVYSGGSTAALQGSTSEPWDSACGGNK